MSLPVGYQDLYLSLSEVVCGACGKVPEHPAICLVTGRWVDRGAWGGGGGDMGVTAGCKEGRGVSLTSWGQSFGGGGVTDKCLYRKVKERLLPPCVNSDSRK
jgi:hypothetical protein